MNQENRVILTDFEIFSGNGMSLAPHVKILEISYPRLLKLPSPACMATHTFLTQLENVSIPLLSSLEGWKL